MTWATNNNVDPADLDCCEFEDRTGDGLADLIRVRVERDPGSLNSNLLDIGAVTVKAKAAAGKMRAVASCVMPWSLDGDETDPPPGGTWGLVPGQLFVFFTKDAPTPGNFGALSLYGNGAADYAEAIKTPCGSGGGCAQGEPVHVGETIICEVKTGVMGNVTPDALEERYGTSTACDVATAAPGAYDQAVSLAETAACQDRAVPVPIIKEFQQGHSVPIDILGLATFYIAGWDRRPPLGDVDLDGDGQEDYGIVWGYFLDNQPVIPAWEIVWDYSDDPFAPIKIMLVE
jgi:hypothetical protein